MRSTDPTDEAELDPSSEIRATPRGHRRLIAVFCLLVAILLLTFIPPLFNVGRFHRRIADNISAALGRPVHFDDVSLTLLPIPGFTLKTFVIDDDPAFGSEPILRANLVQVTLRVSSLWQHAEFSRIALTEPSVNLVRATNGHWNIESLLLEASHIQAAPTDQRFAGPARRFPYIEATGARLNLKLGPEKTPFSLADTDFSLWLPEPHQWHLRLEAHPMRTDTSPGDTGTLRVEGTLGKASLQAATLSEIPIDLHGDWRDAQLGGIGRLLTGHDSGLRGDVSLAFGAVGNVGHSIVTANIKLANARRAEFVPEQLFSLEASCAGTATDTFRSFSSIVCHWPPADSSGPSNVILTADVPDVHLPRSATATVTIPALPAATFYGWLSVATPHAPTGLSGNGTLTGAITWNPAYAKSPVDPADPRKKLREPQPEWSGELELSNESLQSPALGPNSIPLGVIRLQSAPGESDHYVTQSGFDLQPVSIPLGGKQPATLEGRFDATGYKLHLEGTVVMANLLELGKAIPQFGDGLLDVLHNAPTPPSIGKEPVTMPLGGAKVSAALSTLESDNALPEDDSPLHIDLTATRTWGGPQTWRETNPPPSHPRHRHN